MNSEWGADGEYREIFIEETNDQLNEWEESLLELEKGSSQKEQIDRLFRTIHTIKGSSGFVNFIELQQVCHHLEDCLHEIRDGKTDLTTEVIDLFFQGLDISKKLLEKFIDNQSLDDLKSDIDDFISKLDSSIKSEPLNSDSLLEENKEALNDEKQKASDFGDHFYSIQIEIKAKGQEGYLKGILTVYKLEEAGKILEISPTLEDLKDKGKDYKYRVLINTDKPKEEIKKVLQLDQVIVSNISEIEKESIGRKSNEVKGNDFRNIYGGKGTENEDNDKKLIQIDDVVKVPVEKLDTMLNLVGEIVVQNSGILSVMDKIKILAGKNNLINDLNIKIEGLSKIIRTLQDAVMDVRMLPVGLVFNRFTRMVRDLARSRNKEIEFEIYGKNTEVDKKIIDKIGEPILHLLRNAVDHGIETKEERKRLGKDGLGHIRLGAYYRGDRMCIELSDDGKGIDRDAIIKKAVEKGIFRWKDAVAMDDDEIFKLIFKPGFSTADEITDISGRGVGLDVVKEIVEEMSGDIKIQSERNNGTVITISLPITMAIISAILVETMENIFALPITSVREIVEIDMNNLELMGNTPVFRLREEIISVVSLSEILGFENMQENTKNRKAPLVIVNYEDKGVGICVSKILGNKEIVVKSLSKNYKEIKGITGATILGDGKPAIILDPISMLRSYYQTDFSNKNIIALNLVDIKNKESKATNYIESKEKSFAGKIDESSDLYVLNDINVKNIKKNVNGVQKYYRGSEKAFSTILEDLYREHKEMFDEILMGGTLTASMALKEFLGKEVRMNFPEMKMIKINEVTKSLGGDELPVAGIYTPIFGDIDGGILIVFPANKVLRLSDFILKRTPGTTKVFQGKEKSTFLELGNILTDSFIEEIINTTGFNINKYEMKMRIDMYLSLIDSILARFNHPGDSVLLIETELWLNNFEESNCQMFLFLEPDSMISIIKAIKKSGEESFSKVGGYVG